MCEPAIYFVFLETNYINHFRQTFYIKIWIGVPVQVRCGVLSLRFYYVDMVFLLNITSRFVLSIFPYFI